MYYNNFYNSYSADHSKINLKKYDDDIEEI